MALVLPTEMIPTRQRRYRRTRGDWWTRRLLIDIADSEKPITEYDLPTYYPAAGTEAASGTATAATASTLTDSGASWGSHTGKRVYIKTGTGKGQMRTITSNTATVLTISTGSTDWTVTPDDTSTYTIRSFGIADPYLMDVETVPYRDDVTKATVVARWWPPPLDRILRDNPDWGILMATLAMKMVSPAKDRTSPDPQWIRHEWIEAVGGDKEMRRKTLSLGDGQFLEPSAAYELRLAQRKATSPTLTELKGLVGYINDGTADSTSKLVGAVEGTLLLAGVKILMSYDPATLNLVTYYLLHSRLGWNSENKTIDQRVEVRQWDVLLKDGNDTGYDRAVSFWTDVAGTEVTLGWYPSANFTPINGLVKWYS